MDRPPLDFARGRSTQSTHLRVGPAEQCLQSPALPGRMHGGSCWFSEQASIAVSPDRSPISPPNLWNLRGKLIPGFAKVRNVVVDEELENTLPLMQSHQKEGVEFIYRNCFSDCDYFDEGSEAHIG